MSGVTVGDTRGSRTRSTIGTLRTTAMAGQLGEHLLKLPSGRARDPVQGEVATTTTAVTSNVEMSSLQKKPAGFDRSDPNAILNECRDIDKGIDQVQDNVEALRRLQDRSLIEADATATRREIDSLSSRTMASFRELTDRVRMVKSVPEGRQPRNSAQVGRVERRLKEANQEYQQVEAGFRKKTQDQMARQYRIVRPNASEAEVRAAVEDTSGNAQVFQQALMQGNRMGEATSTLNAVRARQQDMAKIEQTLGELVQLFTDLSVLIEQQETQFVDISQKTEMVEEDVRQANVEIGTAVQTARSTRKKKWICLGICVAILVVIAVIVVVYIMVNRAANGSNNTATTTTTKRSFFAPRSVTEDLQMNTARSVNFAGERGPSRIFSQSKIVTPNLAFDTKNLPVDSAGSLQKREALSDKLDIENLAFDQNRLPPGSQGSLQRREALSDKLDIENLAFDQNRIPPGSQGSLQRRKRFIIPDDLPGDE
ncbi:syntaxin family protein [Podospora aff. communis PSN243]|uniref:Syntaxin family protein n=1 Tax=Podospora aff. communis PSN243 TaxID=3040156 RepID=A0AAV9GV51_9PEZI|nr:syntaxin family protein [Podospora aff. communis PSN243]